MSAEPGAAPQARRTERPPPCRPRFAMIRHDRQPDASWRSARVEGRSTGAGGRGSAWPAYALAVLCVVLGVKPGIVTDAIEPSTRTSTS